MGQVSTPFSSVAGRFVGFQILTGVGGTYVPTAGARKFIVEGVGAGGGAGGLTNGGPGVVIATCGGGSGAYFLKRYGFSAAIAASYPFSCGVHGNGGAAGNNNGTAGGNTTFDAGGALLTAPGGSFSTFTDGVATPSIPGAGGAIATGGDLNLTGNGGLPTLTDPFGTSSYIGYASPGGSPARFGAGGLQRTTQGDGNAASGFGGGGGGCLTAGAVNRAGGNGSDGVIFVWEYS